MIATIETAEQVQTRKPLVQYFDSDATHRVMPGEMVHDYYGVPTWLLKAYLLRIHAAVVGETLFQKGECWMELSPAPIKQIGSLTVGGARLQFTGSAQAIQAVLTELEWMTQRV